MWLETLNDMRKRSGLSLEELSRKSGVPMGTLSKITAGITRAPALETVRSLVYAMGYTLSDLDEEERRTALSRAETEHIRRYRALDRHGREMVELVLAQETARLAAEREPEEEAVIYFNVPEYVEPMSAGTGELAGEGTAENLLLTKEPPKGTSYVARVKGDSMEPDYRDGDRVFVRVQERVQPGEIGVFYMDGQQWLKELGEGELLSRNPKYDPRPITPDIRCQGRVLGVCDESYFM